MANAPRFYLSDANGKYVRDDKGNPRTYTESYFRANPDKFPPGSRLGKQAVEDVSAQTVDGTDKQEEPA